MKYYLSILFVFLFTTASFTQSVNYSISMEDPHTHYFNVKLNMSEFNRDSLDIKMPVWAPGSYLVREFSKSVENFKVENGTFKIINKNTWRIYPQNQNNISISYQVYAYEMSVRTSFLNSDHGYINGTSIFMYTDEIKNLPCTLKITPFKEWKTISTALPSLGNNTFMADDYDILVDSPIEIGNHKEFSFSASDVNHNVAMYGDGNYTEETLQKDMAKVVEECTKVFGVNPNKDYTFIIHNLTKGSGGLEHLASTTLQVNRWGYSPESKYQGFLSLVAHEYFHLWNVKRIRPSSLGPFNYDQENYTRLLWLSEGFTSYYDELLLKRAGYYDAEKYLSVLANTISRVENQPGNKVLPVAEASFYAWIKAYRPTENSYNTTISYYPKGALLAAMLDLEIINNSKGERNLDNVMQDLYNNYYLAKNRGITDTELKSVLESNANINLDDFFSKYVNGTETINYEKFLGYAGCEIINDTLNTTTPSLGVSTKLKGGKLTISMVKRGTCGYKFGLNVNDELLAINNYRIDDSNLSKVLENMQIGETINVTISRDGILQIIPITLSANWKNNFSINKIEKPSKSQTTVFKKWLNE